MSLSPPWNDAQAPDWFRRAIEAPTRSHHADASGARIHYLSWNAHETHKPGLLLVHGFRAHARWWSWTAPYLTDHHRVFALDFAGMGDSEHRTKDDALTFALDIGAVIRHANIGPATVVAHSFGGGRTMRLCAEQPELVAHAIIVDSYVHFPERDAKRPFISAGPRRVYPTLEAAKERFRLLPPAGAAADYVIDYIAHHSLEAVEGGFRWKFADDLSPDILEVDGPSVLRRIEVPLTYLHGEHSQVGTSARAAEIVRLIRGARGPIAIPEAHHHVMLDQPLALIAALRSLLAP